MPLTTHSDAKATVRDAIVAFGEGHGAHDPPVHWLRHAQAQRVPSDVGVVAVARLLQSVTTLHMRHNGRTAPSWHWSQSAPRKFVGQTSHFVPAQLFRHVHLHVPSG